MNYDPVNPLGDASRCPHCGAFARVVASDELRFVCGVCGAPRIEAPGAQLSGRELGPLKASQAARKSRALWRIGGAFAGAFGAAGVLFSVLFGLIFSWAFAAVGLTLTLPFVILAVVALAKSGARSAEVTRALQEAWKSAARDVVLRSREGMTPEQLSKILPLTEAGAEALLTELAVEDAFQSRITDDGKLLVFSPSAASLRIDAGAEPHAKTQVSEPADPLEARFAELEESLAAEEQASDEARGKKSD